MYAFTLQFNRDKTVYVNHYYFYIDDEDFGPLFLKVCSDAPWGSSCVGHRLRLMVLLVRDKVGAGLRLGPMAMSGRSGDWTNAGSAMRRSTTVSFPVTSRRSFRRSPIRWSRCRSTAFSASG